MNYRVGLTRISMNEKTGPIPVSTTEAKTCPPTCAQFDTCYAKFGHLPLHWAKITSGERGMDWADFCDEIHRLPRQQLWRHNQAGDLPGDGARIDVEALYALAIANKGKRGFTYTHYPMDNDHNLRCVEASNAEGFTVNISCDSLTDSDAISHLTNAPQAVVLPSTTTAHALRTPEGRKVVVCPATYRDDVNCANCQICYESGMTRAVIGFPAHGTKKRIIDIRLEKT